MNNLDSTFTPQQVALQQLALWQLRTVSETFQRLLGITSQQGDKEAVQDVAGGVAASVELLR